MDVEKELRERLKFTLQIGIAVFAHGTTLSKFQPADVCAIPVVDFAIHQEKVSAKTIRRNRWLFLRQWRGFADVSSYASGETTNGDGLCAAVNLRLKTPPPAKDSPPRIEPDGAYCDAGPFDGRKPSRSEDGLNTTFL